MANDQEVSVTLKFRNQKERDFFMGGLSDGFGENIVSLEWPWLNWTAPERASGKAFGECGTFGVRIMDAEGYKHCTGEELPPYEGDGE